MDQIDIFARFPRASWIGVVLSLGIFGTIFPIAPALAAIATLASIAGLWILFVLALRVERRTTYATVGLLLFGLFVISVSTVLPELITTIIEAIR